MTGVGRSSYPGTDVVSAPTADIGSGKGFSDVAPRGAKQVLTRSKGGHGGHGVGTLRHRSAIPALGWTHLTGDRQESAGGSLTPDREYDSLGGPIPTLLFGMPQVDTA